MSERHAIARRFSIMAITATMAILAMSSLKPIKPNRKLHCVDPGIGRGQAGVGDVLVAGTESEGAIFVSKQMQAQRCMCEKVCSVGACRNIVVAEQHSATKFEVRHRANMRSKVPLEVYRVKTCSISILSRLQQVIERHEIGRPFKIAAYKPARMISGENFSQAHTRIDHLSI